MSGENGALLSLMWHIFSQKGAFQPKVAMLGDSNVIF
jgi:hypothetical protein